MIATKPEDGLRYRRLDSYENAPDEIPAGHEASPGNDGIVGSPDWLPEGYWERLPVVPSWPAGAAPQYISDDQETEVRDGDLVAWVQDEANSQMRHSGAPVPLSSMFIGAGEGGRYLIEREDPADDAEE